MTQTDGSEEASNSRTMSGSYKSVANESELTVQIEHTTTSCISTYYKANKTNGDGLAKKIFQHIGRNAFHCYFFFCYFSCSRRDIRDKLQCFTYQDLICRIHSCRKSEIAQKVIL